MSKQENLKATKSKEIRSLKRATKHLGRIGGKGNVSSFTKVMYVRNDPSDPRNRDIKDDPRKSGKELTLENLFDDYGDDKFDAIQLANYVTKCVEESRKADSKKESPKKEEPIYRKPFKGSIQYVVFH